MSLRTQIVAVLCCAAALSGCGKKTAAELAEEERAAIREKKREEAVKVYKELAEKLPEHPKAKDAASKAQTLAAEAPKK